MGCGTSNTVEKEGKDKLQEKNEQEDDQLRNLDNKFNDMPESKTGLMIGFGLKRIPNYICPLAYDKLESLRKQFWMTRKKTDEIWVFLQQCCEADEDESKKILKANKIYCIDGTLSNSYYEKKPNYVYHIPNFCITDPIFERDFDKYEKIYDQTDDSIIKVNIFYQNQGENYTMKIRNKCTGFDFKHQFAKIINIDLKKNYIRLFNRGQEILDTHCLYYHSITSKDTIQAISNERPSKGGPKSQKKMKRNTNNEQDE